MWLSLKRKKFAYEDTQNYTHKYPAPYRKENPVKITKETNVILGY